MMTKEKIEVMQAYEKGETIECASLESEDRVWLEVKYPLWNWSAFEYRIKPEESEFKTGDRAVFRQDEADTLALKDIHAYGDPGCMNSFVFWKVDDVLWYWEYQDADDRWEKSDYRATRAEIEKLSNFHNFAPLYALGFRLSQNLKDEK